MNEEHRTKAIDLLVGDSTWVVWVEDDEEEDNE